MNPIQAIIISCWIILGLYWIVSSFFQKKDAENQNFANRFSHIIFMIISFTLLIRYDIYSPFSKVIISQSTAIDIISIILCLWGLFIAIWARKTIGKNWSSKVVFKENHELIQSGPYKYARHPIYTGYLVMFLGTAFAVGRIGGFIGLAVLFLGFWIKLKQEESLMIKHFGKKYIDYKKKVKALIPYVI